MRRLIPILQLDKGALVKTVKFSPKHYLGDPLNALRLFNELEVDEIAVIDLSAAKTGVAPDSGFVHELVSEAFMPVLYAGGIRTAKAAISLARCGVEKIGMGSALFEHGDEVRSAAAALGSQSVVGMIDVDMTWTGKQVTVFDAGRRRSGLSPVDASRQAVSLGCGELMVTSVDRDGTRSGYDTRLLRSLAEAVNVPLIGCGGASDWKDLRAAFDVGHCEGAAGGTVFTLEGPRFAMLVKYPIWDERESLGLL